VIIEMDQGKSRLKSMKDDRGTDLTPKGDRRRAQAIGWVFPAEDGRSMRFRLQNQNAIPARGATKITAKAELALVCGSDLKTDERKDVPLQDGAAANVGPLKMKIAKVTELTPEPDKEKEGALIFAPARLKGARMSFRLTTGKEPEGRYMDCIRTITFLNAEGKEIRHKARSTWTYGGKAYMKEYDLARKVDSLTIRVSWFGKIETITVPVEVTAGLGL
jgi:hypothetical protein